MALFSSTNLNETQDLLSSVDAIITALEKTPDNDCVDAYANISPFALLLMLLKSIGVDKDEIIKFLVDFIKYELPIIELGIKGILLSNLKEMISCSVDPRIPAYARDGDDYYYNSGITLDLSVIDSNGKLSQSPLDEVGGMLYFGTDGCTSPYDFLRGDDFDTFLWLLIHKSKFPNSTNITELDDFKKLFNASNINGGDNLFDALTISYPTEDDINCGILPGSSFKQGENNIISVCTNATLEKDKIVENKLYPIGDKYDRINWYINRMCFFNFMEDYGVKVERDYSKDVGLFSLKYIDNVADSTMFSDNSVYLKNQINFKILRKPEVIVDENLVPRILLFNSKGEFDIDGRFTTLDASRYYHSDENKCDIEGLCECYPKLTIYEFNFDYIFGMRILEPKTVITNLVNSLLGLSIGINTKLLNKTEENIIIQERIENIVRKIVEANDKESSDCFFSFSNDEIDEQNRNAELRRSNLIPFGEGQTSFNESDLDEIRKLINDFSNSKQEGDVEIFKRLVEKVSVTIQPQVEQEGDFGFNKKLGLDIINQFILNLVMILVNAILTPKIIMMIAINQKLCGKFSKDKWSLEGLLNQMLGMITSIVSEIRDLILQQLLNFVLSKFSGILIEFGEKLLLEQIMVYKKLLKQLIDTCWTWNRTNLNLATSLDKVNYADIDDVNNQPKTDKC